MRVSAAIGAAALALLACQSPQHVEDLQAGDETEGWKEIAVKFPPYPRSENFIQFDVEGASPHRFYIDSPSLAVGSDGVVRYTLVTRTAGGATNITFEGIRCQGRRHKYYAVGEAGGTWAAARNPHWRRIEYQDADRQRLALVDTFLCEGRFPRGSQKAILDALKRTAPYQF
jgi:CNP1-like family